jgi:hypothetical protein
MLLTVTDSSSIFSQTVALVDSLPEELTISRKDAITLAIAIMLSLQDKRLSDIDDELYSLKQTSDQA